MRIYAEYQRTEKVLSVCKRKLDVSERGNDE